jgi:hypothetical protein
MVQPYNAQDIAIALGVVRRFGCHFAVFGGGTSPFKGASNAHNGVTIDLYALNKVKFTNAEKTHVRVGGGAIWADVYRYLDPKNMSAVGTRNSLTGVAGSIIGGKESTLLVWTLLTIIQEAFHFSHKSMAGLATRSQSLRWYLPIVPFCELPTALTLTYSGHVVEVVIILELSLVSLLRCFRKLLPGISIVDGIPRSLDQPLSS